MGLQEANETKLRRRVYNIGGISPTAGEIAKSVRIYVENSGLKFSPDKTMQEIVDGWPEALDETRAREEWGWTVRYNLDDMGKDFIKEVRSFGIRRR